MSFRGFVLLGGSAALLGLAACSSSTAAVPVEYLEASALDRHEIGVRERQDVLEVALNPADTSLPRAERLRIDAFLQDYRSVGHGPLKVSLPTSSANPQLAVAAASDIREMAFASGIEYAEIEGGSAGEGNGTSQIVLSFTRYDAIAPECETFATLDFASTRLNNDLPTLGCSVRTNMAAMIADPADLLGQRQLEPGDTERRQITLELWRSGAATGSERNEGESGTVSDAVQTSN